MLMALDDNFTKERNWNITDEKRSKTKRIVDKICRFMEVPDSSLGAKVRSDIELILILFVLVLATIVAIVVLFFTFSH